MGLGHSGVPERELFGQVVSRGVSALFQSCSLGGAIDGEGGRQKRLAAVLQDCGHSFQGRRPSG